MNKTDIKEGIVVVCNKTHKVRIVNYGTDICYTTVEKGTKFVICDDKMIGEGNEVKYISVHYFGDVYNRFWINEKKFKYFDTKVGRVKRLAKEHLND